MQFLNAPVVRGHLEIPPKAKGPEFFKALKVIRGLLGDKSFEMLRKKYVICKCKILVYEFILKDIGLTQMSCDLKDILQPFTYPAFGKYIL